ncbi:MAG: hypothetical protein GDA48_00130, partial [Hormoscilla sp. GM102CHS1]|nr:hypothetical protein [Hormoscilla sp. GM102CHS1]
MSKLSFARMKVGCFGPPTFVPWLLYLGAIARRKNAIGVHLTFVMQPLR